MDGGNRGTLVTEDEETELEVWSLQRCVSPSTFPPTHTLKGYFPNFSMGYVLVILRGD